MPRAADRDHQSLVANTYQNPYVHLQELKALITIVYDSLRQFAIGNYFDCENRVAKLPLIAFNKQTLEIGNKIFELISIMTEL